MPGTDRDMPWYSFDHGPVHFVVISSEHDLDDQYKFVIKDLAMLNRTISPWVVFATHRPMYVSSKNSDTPDGDQTIAEQIRDVFEVGFDPFALIAARASTAAFRGLLATPFGQPGAAKRDMPILTGIFPLVSLEQELLYVAEVDLVVAGHHHSYQRTCPVLKGECALPRPNTTNGSYVAPVNVIVGMAGFASTTNIETPQPPIFQVILSPERGTLDPHIFLMLPSPQPQPTLPGWSIMS